MLIDLSDVLASESREVTAQVPLELAGFNSRMGSFPVVEKSPAAFTFTNIEPHKARISGKATLVFQACCDRCLTEVPLSLELSFDRIVVSPDGEQEDEDDQGFMEGSQLNTETFVHNEILVNWPEKILCRDDCRGLCLKCGQNLNEGKCGCDTFVPDPRMAVIQDIFNGNKEV